MIKLISNRSEIRIETEGIKLLQAGNAAEFPLEAIEDCRGLIVDGADIKYALTLLARVRSASSSKIFLKPVFIFSNTSVNDRYLLEASDGHLDSRNLLDVFDISETINQRSSRFQDFQGYDPLH